MQESEIKKQTIHCLDTILYDHEVSANVGFVMAGTHGSIESGFFLMKKHFKLELGPLHQVYRGRRGINFIEVRGVPETCLYL